MTHLDMRRCSYTLVGGQGTAILECAMSAVQRCAVCGPPCAHASSGARKYFLQQAATRATCRTVANASDLLCLNIQLRGLTHILLLQHLQCDGTSYADKLGSRMALPTARSAHRHACSLMCGWRWSCAGFY